jgi:hypothetical protein
LTRSVFIALAAAVASLPFACIGFLFAWYVAAIPRFTPSWERGDALANPLRLFIAPAAFSLLVFAVVLVTMNTRPLGTREVVRGMRRFAVYAALAIFASSCWYAAANIRNWDNADAIVSSALIALLSIGAIAIGWMARSVSLAGRLLITPAPFWVAGVVIARILAIFLSLVWLVTIGRFFIE